MKLSEAIRLGGMMKPQGQGERSLISVDAPCALGGALQSIGQQPPKKFFTVYAATVAMRLVASNWPFTLRPAKCPCCGSDHGLCAKQKHVGNIIAVLNDCHGWSRNQIADWVETVEPAEEAQQEAALPSWLTKKARPE